MKNDLDYRNIAKNKDGKLEFFSSRPKLSLKPKRANGEGLTVDEKQFAWNWYQTNARRINLNDAFGRALKNYSGREDAKSTDLKILKSYFSYGNNEASLDAYINLKRFSTLVK